MRRNVSHSPSLALFLSSLWNCSRFMSSRSSAIQIFQPLLLASATGSQSDEAQKETDIEMEGNNFSRGTAVAVHGSDIDEL